MVQYQNLSEDQQTKLLVKHLILDGKIFSEDGTISEAQIAEIKATFGTKGFAAARDTEEIIKETEKVATGDLPPDYIASLHKHFKEGFSGCIHKKTGKLVGYIDTTFISDEQYQQNKTGEIDYSKFINADPSDMRNRNLYLYSFVAEEEYRTKNLFGSPVFKMCLEELADWLADKGILEENGFELSSFTTEPITDDGDRIADKFGMHVESRVAGRDYDLRALPPEKVKEWVRLIRDLKRREVARANEFDKN